MNNDENDGGNHGDSTEKKEVPTPVAVPDESAQPIPPAAPDPAAQAEIEDLKDMGDDAHAPTARVWISQLLLGISSGLPFLLVGGTFQAWMTDRKIDLSLIGGLSLVKLPYSLKFLWSPLLDRFKILKFPRRKGWILLTQSLLVAAILAISELDPAAHLGLALVMATLIAFFSASQDIVIDAYRRETLPERWIGMGFSVGIAGYRIGMLIAGAGAFFIADRIAWPQVYKVMAAMMSIGVLGTLISPERDLSALAPKNLKEAFIAPFAEFLSKPAAWWILFFIIFYKIGDNLVSNVTTPYILTMGYTKTQYAAIAKIVGMLATIFGGIVGAAWVARKGIKSSLWVFGVLQAVSIPLFIIISDGSHSLWRLGVVITVENLCFGMGAIALVTFLARLTSLKYTATQYALLSSLTGISGSVFSAPAGFLAKEMGWEGFFVFCAILAIPGLMLLRIIGDNVEHQVEEPFAED